MKNKNLSFAVLFITSFFAFGLFMEYLSCLWTGFLGLFLVIRSGKEKRWVFYSNPESILILTIAGSYLLTCLYGVDRGMSLIGFFRILGIVFFLLILMGTQEDERDRLFSLIPRAGAVMTAVGISGYLIPSLGSFFLVADRLGSFFQYPNVYALFCLTGILIQVHLRKSRKAAETLGLTIVLLAGILLSGSRTVFFLALLAAAVTALRYRELRRPALLLTLAAAGAALLYAAVTGNVQNVGRFLTSSLSSSTLIGRIIYAMDGAGLLLFHPAGMGYLGYYYKAPEIQTAMYSVRFVHNDLLQLALDGGLLPAMLFAAVLTKNILSRRLPFMKRLILAVFGLHLLMDFDLEFVSMWYLLILLLDPCHGKKWTFSLTLPEKQGKPKRQGFSGSAGFSAPAAVLLFSFSAFYMGAAMLPRYMGNPQLSRRLLPFYTESGADALGQLGNSPDGVALAESLLEQNPYVPYAYAVLAEAAFEKEDYQEMTADLKTWLSLQKYNMDACEYYAYILSEAIKKESQADHADTTVYLLEAAAEIPRLLDEVEKGTSRLAYKTRDIPDFTLSEETSVFIQTAQALLESG